MFLTLLQRGILNRQRGVRCSPVTSPVALLADGCEASIDYFVRPELSRRGWAYGKLDLRRLPPVALDSGGCRTIIIVRYLDSTWKDALLSFRERGGRIIYFMDDDLMDEAAASDLPPTYRRKIWRSATRWRTFIEEVCEEFWVSSKYLAEKYAQLGARLLLPSPVRSPLDGDPVSIFYHGTSSHIREIEWLRPVISEVNRRTNCTRFEVVGDHTINKLFRPIPRVTVLHPMSWGNYLSYSATVRQDIGLAPLLPHSFNAARAPTKFFDFARMGALGIYSDTAPYRDFVRHNVDGLLLPNDPTLWIDTIAELVNDSIRRERMAEAACARANEMVWDSLSRISVENISHPRAS